MVDAVRGTHGPGGRMIARRPGTIGRQKRLPAPGGVAAALAGRIDAPTGPEGGHAAG